MCEETECGGADLTTGGCVGGVYYRSIPSHLMIADRNRTMASTKVVPVESLTKASRTGGEMI